MSELTQSSANQAERNGIKVAITVGMSWDQAREAFAHESMSDPDYQAITGIGSDASAEDQEKAVEAIKRIIEKSSTMSFVAEVLTERATRDPSNPSLFNIGKELVDPTYGHALIAMLNADVIDSQLRKSLYENFLVPSDICDQAQDLVAQSDHLNRMSEFPNGMPVTFKPTLDPDGNAIVDVEKTIDQWRRHYGDSQSCDTEYKGLVERLNESLVQYQAATRVSLLIGEKHIVDQNTNKHVTLEMS